MQTLETTDAEHAVKIDNQALKIANQSKVNAEQAKEISGLKNVNAELTKQIEHQGNLISSLYGMIKNINTTLFYLLQSGTSTPTSTSISTRTSSSTSSTASTSISSTDILPESSFKAEQLSTSDKRSNHISSCMDLDGDCSACIGASDPRPEWASPCLVGIYPNS